jgi:hypothetical protein
MCRLLVRWIDKPDTVQGHPNTKVGDVVIVAPDDWVWGRLEGYPQYLKVDLPGIPVEDATFLQDIQTDPDAAEPGEYLYRREWGIMSNRITPPILADLTAAYEANVAYVVENPDGILNWIRRKYDNAPPQWGHNPKVEFPGQVSVGASMNVG